MKNVAGTPAINGLDSEQIRSAVQAWIGTSRNGTRAYVTDNNGDSVFVRFVTGDVDHPTPLDVMYLCISAPIYGADEIERVSFMVRKGYDYDVAFMRGWAMAIASVYNGRGMNVMDVATREYMHDLRTSYRMA